MVKGIDRIFVEGLRVRCHDLPLAAIGRWPPGKHTNTPWREFGPLRFSKRHTVNRQPGSILLLACPCPGASGCSCNEKPCRSSYYLAAIWIQTHRHFDFGSILDSVSKDKKHERAR